MSHAKDANYLLIQDHTQRTDGTRTVLAGGFSVDFVTFMRLTGLDTVWRGGMPLNEVSKLNASEPDRAGHETKGSAP